MKATIKAYKTVINEKNTGIIEIDLGGDILKIFVAPCLCAINKVYGYVKKHKSLHLECNTGEEYIWVSKFAHKRLKEITEWENIQDREYPPDYCI
ncbi:hypothetical protein FACS1894120_2020 [Clostridia bacterium]|nr:hypothetical protein FACS1894120_2020 [Clostridia bacterium]